MADKTTYIKIDRNILHWRWFQTPKVLSVFIWLLIKANIRDGSFEKDIVHRGSLITSNAHIAEGCGLTISNVRTALANLEETGEIKREVRNHYQLITISNYELYQSDIPKTRGQIASNLDSNLDGNSQANRNNQRKKEGKEEKKEKEDASVFDSPIGKVTRGTDRFRSVSHLILSAEQGTIDDIPIMYRDGTYQSFKKFADYKAWRNQ